MGKQKFIKERIVYTKEESLTAEDTASIKNEIKRQLKIIRPAFILMTLAGLYVWINGPFTQHRLSDEDWGRFYLVAPYVINGFWFILLVFYISIYQQVILPMKKDLKSGKKLRLFFEPKKSAMPVFNKLFLGTPLYDHQELEVSKEDFDNIAEPYLLNIEIGPASCYILNLKKEDHVINYW